MEQLGQILTQGQGAQNTGLISRLAKSLSSEELAQAKERIEARKAQFVNPRRDADTNDFVETNCLTCKDLLKVHHDVHVDHIDFGKLFPCPDCGGGFDKTAHLLKHSGIQVAQMKTFTNFQTRTGTKMVIEAARQFAEGPLQMLLLYGISGSGKTHLAQAAGRALIENSQIVKFIMGAALLLDLKAGFSDEFDFANRMQGWIKAPILILDDMEWRTQFDMETLNDLLCQREFAEVRTLVTTNRKYADLQAALPRVISRFSDPLVGRIVANEASDFRRKT